jgi:hypothetical protein
LSFRGLLRISLTDLSLLLNLSKFFQFVLIFRALKDPCRFFFSFGLLKDFYEFKSNTVIKRLLQLSLIDFKNLSLLLSLRELLQYFFLKSSLKGLFLIFSLFFFILSDSWKFKPNLSIIRLL